MSEQQNVQVVFTPSGRRGQIQAGKTVLEAAQQLGVDLDTVCGGRGVCDRCQIDLSVGEFSKLGIHSKLDHLSTHSASEKEFFPDNTPATRRLGCQARLRGDVVVDVPPESQAHRQMVRKRLDVHDMTLNSSVRLYYVEVPQPNMHEPTGDLERMMDALEFEWGLAELSYDFHVLPELQKILREDDWRVTVAVYKDKSICAVWPGIKSQIYGLAVDVGSTTIAAHLMSLTTGESVASNGRMNPQIRFGEDLMSRVSYSMMNPGGDKLMTQAVQEALQGLLEDLVKTASIDLNEVMDITLVGNPVMHHLLLGIDPVELGGAPFALATDRGVECKASELNITANRGARVYLLPCIAGHVGADAAAATLSEAPYEHESYTLLVDVGTNAEIVLGNNNKMVAASSPTGPAFEGAQISGGQRAAPGAIERVRIDKETLEPRFAIIGCELWSDEEGFEQAVAESGVTGICGSGIIEVIAEMFLSGIVRVDGVIDGRLASKSSRIIADGKTFSYMLYDSGKVKVCITQQDVRAIQLAKAALYAGSALLMDKLKLDKVDRIRLAGAFGAHIDVKYAMVLGMLPDCDLENVSSAGNAAGKGAVIALLDQDARSEIEDVVKRIEKVETAVEPKFQEHFVEALAIPHKTAPYTQLRQQVTLPEPVERQQDAESEAGEGGRRRRRRRS